MLTPYDPRIVKLLEALAHTVDSYDGLEPEVAIAVLGRLCVAVSKTLPGPEPGNQIRKLYQTGIRTSKDVRYDPQPGDTLNLDFGTYTVIARHDNYIMYQWDTGSGKKTSGSDISHWNTWCGIYIPGSRT